MYNFGFWGLAALHVKSVPTFQKMLQFLSSGWMSVEEKGSPVSRSCSQRWVMWLCEQRSWVLFNEESPVVKNKIEWKEANKERWSLACLGPLSYFFWNTFPFLLLFFLGIFITTIRRNTQNSFIMSICPSVCIKQAKNRRTYFHEIFKLGSSSKIFHVSSFS